MNVVVLGAGGHGVVVLESLLACGHDVVGFLDARADLHGSRICGVTVLGGDELLGDIVADGFHVGVGSVGDTALRRQLWEAAHTKGLTPVDAVHPSAIVSSSAVAGPGLAAMASAVINPRARLGHNVVVNTGAIVEHDCVVGDHAYLASGAVLGAGAEIGEGAHVGLGAVVNQGIRVGAGAVVGSGAVVVRDVPAGETVAGVPARPLEARP